MLKKMRENTKTILWIVVVTFVISIFAVWGMNMRGGGSNTPQQQSDAIGSVDGVELTRQMYSNSWQELYTNIRMQRGEDYKLSDTESYMLSEQAWESLIQKVLIDREIKRDGIVVTDNELVSFLRRNPHPTLRQMFTNEEGQFDYQAYLQALSNPNADWTELERWGRSVLPELKLETMLSAQVHVSDLQIRKRFDRQNARMQARYVRVPFVVEDPPYEPSDAELSALYSEKKDDFKLPETRSIEMIRMEKAATEADEKDIFEQISDLRREIIGGTYDFAEAAKQESDDYNTAQKGGDLGFFGRGVMDSLFTETAFSQKVGEISKPVRTSFGYHLIRTDEKKVEDGEEKVRASHILMKVEPGYDTIDSLRTLVTDLRELIKEKGLEAAAADMGLELLKPEPFQQGAFIKDYGYLPRVVNFAFTNGVGKISDLMETQKYMYMAKVTGINAERVMPMEEVRDRLVSMIRKDRSEEMTLEKAGEIRASAVTGGDLEAAAHSFELEVAETPPFTVDQSIPGIGTGTAFASAAYELPTGKVSPPIRGNSEYFIILVTDRKPGTPSELTAQRQQILQQLRQEASSRFLALWYDDLRKKAKVVDKRESTLN